MNKNIVALISKLARGVTLIVAALLGAQAVKAQTPKADYQFQNTYNSAVSGAPSLVNIGGRLYTEYVDDKQFRTVFLFNERDGLTLSTAAIIPDNGRYTIVLFVRFTGVFGYNRVIDFKSGDPDSGAYIQDDHLEHGGGKITESQWVQITYTRDGTRESQRGYVDGVPVLDGSSPSASDLPIGPSNSLVFFIDDGDESSSGAIARLRIYDRALSEAQVAALDRIATAPACPCIARLDVYPALRNPVDIARRFRPSTAYLDINGYDRTGR